jgi:hypothetical protein
MSDQRLMKQYLLGRLSTVERIDLENRYLSDSAEFEEFTETENDLIDSYALGTLADVDKKAFEQQYLGLPGQRARIEFARALAEISRQHDHVPLAEKSPFWERFTLWVRPHTFRLQWAIAAGIVAIVLAFWSLRSVHNREMQALHQPTTGRGERTQPPPAMATHPVPQSPHNGDTPRTQIAKNDKPELSEFTMRLSPGLSRGQEAKATVFVVPSQISHIKLQLSLDDDDHTEYVAEIETAEGTKVHRIENLKKELVHGVKVVTVRLPSRLIPAGDYVVRLDGIGQDGEAHEEIDVYSFRTLRK